MISKTNVRGFAYPTAIKSLVQHFDDSSYGNDVTDSIVFAIGSECFIVWIDAVDQADRSCEWGWDPEEPVSKHNQPPPRFAVCRLDACASIVETLEERNVASEEAILETDDPDALLAFVRSVS